MTMWICVIATLALLILAMEIYRALRRKVSSSAEQERARIARIALAKLEEMNAKGDMLSEKADKTGERMDRLIALLELTARPTEQEKEGTSREVHRRRRRSA